MANSNELIYVVKYENDLESLKRLRDELDKLNNLPKIGDKVTIDFYELEILDKDGQRVDKILVTKNQ